MGEEFNRPPADDYTVAVSQAFEQTIAAAEAQRTQLQTAVTDAQRQTYTGESADGMVRVTVDGRPRVTQINVNPRVLRSDAGVISQAIVEAANAAIRTATDGTNQAILAGLDPGLRDAVAGGIAASGRAGEAER